MPPLRQPIRSMLLLAAALIGLLAPTVAVGADKTVTFEPPSARVSNFSVYWLDRFRSPTKPTRVELMTRLVGQEAWLVEDASVNKLEGQDRYGAQVYGGSTYPPNARIEYRFRVTPKGAPPETGPARVVTIEDDRIDWKTLKGDLVRLHWQSGDEAFARRALQIAETAIAKTSELLGVTETEPIDFFVYSDAEDFQSALGPGTKEFVAGRAINEIRTMFARIAPDAIGSDWVSIVIPHELVHLVFDTATHNPYHQPPHWLNEGLAVYLSEGYGDADRQRVANAVERHTLLPLSSMTDGFPSSREELFYLGYAEGASAIDFFVRAYGEEELVSLIRRYADGVTDDEAFEAATGEGFAAFEAAWLADLGTTAPAAQGPQEAEAGPTPADWVTVGGSESTAGGTSPPDQGSLPGAATPTSNDGAVPGILAGLIVLGGLGLLIVVLVRRRRTNGPDGAVALATPAPASDAVPGPVWAMDGAPDVLPPPTTTTAPPDEAATPPPVDSPDDVPPPDGR